MTGILTGVKDSVTTLCEEEDRKERGANGVAMDL